MNKLDFLEKNIHKFENVVPCIGEDIVLLEQDLGLTLPGVYKEFLLICGRESGTYLKDDFAHYKRIREIQKFNVEMREDCHYPPPQEGELAILTNYDDGLAFINVLDGDDPPVYFYGRSDWPPKVAYHSLSECYFKRLVSYIELESLLTKKELKLE